MSDFTVEYHSFTLWLLARPTHMMCNICPICHCCRMELFFAYLDYMIVYTDKLNRMYRLSCKLLLLLLLLLLLDYIILTIMLRGPEKNIFWPKWIIFRFFSWQWGSLYLWCNEMQFVFVCMLFEGPYSIPVIIIVFYT